MSFVKISIHFSKYTDYTEIGKLRKTRRNSSRSLQGFVINIKFDEIPMFYLHYQIQIKSWEDVTKQNKNKQL